MIKYYIFQYPTNMKKSKIILKKISLGILGMFLCFSSTLCLWNYDDFLENLKQLWIDVDSILQSKQIDRYELTRLLNGVNCKDCIHPDTSMTSKYTYQRRSDFANKDWNAFNDITYQWWNYKWESYYYCVAYVWDNLWMRWYPNDISPICNGKFCWTRTTTLWEFLQVVVNIADQYIYQRYLVDRQKIKTWMDSLPKWSYADTYLTNDEKFLINQYASNKKTWPLPSEESLQPYLKYCMFNLNDCGMQSFWAIWQWYWPIAELNVLYDNNIVEYTKFSDGQTNELVDWKYVLEVLYNLFQIIDCSFNYDYDCDWLKNKNDNCPNAYNLTQTDTDWDGIGDVCDDDIDGDGIKNPIWIVDDLWSVVISKYKENMDNCLFVPNYQQTDSNWNWLGNECDKENNSLWMYIKSYPIKTTAPASATFEAVTEWNIKWDYTWTFGDGTTAQGKRVTHTFEKFGLYTVQVTANWYSNNAKASTTVLIWNDPQNNYALRLNTDKQNINAWWEITFTINKQWSFDNYQRNFWDGNSMMQTNTSITKRFKDEWVYMVTVKWFKDGKIVAVANTIVWVWDNTYWTKLTTNKIFINKWEKIILQWNINWFSDKDISDISRNFGDTQLVNKNLTQEHVYEKEWTYVITQTINLNNGISLNNFATISVWNQNLENSYTIETSIDKLVTNSYENIWFTISNIWTIPSTTLIVNSYSDGYSTKSYENLNIRPKAFTHQYSKGIFSPKNTVYIDDCIALSTEATIVIDDGDICLKALLNWTLKQFKWDIDGDWIPDICDDDIDGDGYPNLIWMINPNKTWAEIADTDINTTILKLHKWTCQLDNCPTVSNQNQLDLNNNWRWDSCDDINIYKNIWSFSNSIFMTNFNNIFNHENNSTDSDWDGIADSLDACPSLPENYNGVQDFDWCPEIKSQNNCALTNYNYINQNFSVYPTTKTWKLYIVDPTNPEPSCKWDDCKNLCLGSVNNCSNCNWKAWCQICDSNHGFCGDIIGWTGPYTITARCTPENIFHVRHDISILNFSFSDTFEWSCPCKKCHRFAKDVNGLVSNIWNFSVCDAACIDWWDGSWWTKTGSTNPEINTWDKDTDRIIIDDPDDIIPPCRWEGCNTCEWKNCEDACLGNTSNCISCNWDKNCELCQGNPKLCGTWSGGTGPFELNARCEDDSANIYKWYNITSRQFSFSEYFEYKSWCRPCHRFVIDSKWLMSSIWNFEICPWSGSVSWPTWDVTPWCIWWNCAITECTGSTCNTCTDSNCVCVWDIQSCPSCPNSNNPTCNNCNTNPWSCGCRSGREWPIDITARCDNDSSKKYTRNNISWQCFSFDDIFSNTINQQKWDECNQCHRYLTDKWWQNSDTNDFKVCNDWIDIIDPTRPEYTCTWSNCNTCTWNNCDDCQWDNCGICIWSIDDCNSCNWNINCELCRQNPELCGTRSGGTGPYELEARCDNDKSKTYKWYDITDHQFSFTNIWTWECPCKQCNRKIKDINGLTSSTWSFQVCAAECNIWITPIPITGDILPTPTTGELCTGDVNHCPCDTNPNCTSCTNLSTSASWTGNAKGPYELQARCDDEPKNIYSRTNISGYCFDLSKKFQWNCTVRSCHWKVISSEWLTTKTGNFNIKALPSNSCITPSGPDNPVIGCTWNTCNNICIWDIDKCPCENNPSCSSVECSIWWNWCDDCTNSPTAVLWESEVSGPYDITARCPAAIWNKIYKWTNVENSCLNLKSVFEWDCPCKKCFRYVETSDGSVKTETQPFQVCDNSCLPTPRIIPEPLPTPVPPSPTPTPNICTWNVDNCPCINNPNCTSCSNQNSTSASWTGNATWPFTLNARCDDAPDNIYQQSNISGYCYNFSGIFQWDCEPRSCHRYISDSNGLKTNTVDFSVDAIDSNYCITPSGPNPLTWCTGDDCDDICIWDINNCPCENNPSCSSAECNKWWNNCGDCSNSKLSAKWESQLAWPFTVTVVCGEDIKIRSNIDNNCIGLDNVLDWDCPCKTCKWSVFVKWTQKIIATDWIDFPVCDEWCKPDHKCDDWIIDTWENCQNCPEDVWSCIQSCGDGKYQKWETCNNCPQDLWECPSSCGNWILESPEQCDNWLQNGIDGQCSDDCTDLKNYCGNNKIDQNEQCDKWNNNGKYTWEWSCTIACTYFDPNNPSCWNGTVEPWENCDTCEIDLGTACIWICGDSVLNHWEECDNGTNNGKDGICSFECKKVKDKDKYCGNGEIDKDLWEECDFWQTNGINICSNECKFFSETPVCGNGILDKDEECDYGKYLNGTDGINCNNQCKELEPCGNNIIDNNENCDNCPQDLWDKCKPGPDNPNNPLIASGPAWPVIGCSGNNCNNCIWDVNNCNWWPTNICWNGQSENNGTWIGWKWPYNVTAQCDNKPNDIKHWYNISWQCFSFEKYFESDCPCNQCHWFVQDVDWEISEMQNFQVCKDECDSWWENPTPPAPTPDWPITTPECLACPCNYTDFWNTLTLNDDVKAILLDLWMTTLYSESIPVWIMQYLN